MSIADLGLALRHWGEFLYYHPEMGNQSLLCTLSAFTGVFFIIATASWYFLISVFTCITLRGNSRYRERHSKTQKFLEHFFVWGLSTGGAAYPLFAQQYEYNGDDGSCWISATGNARAVIVALIGFYLLFAFGLLIQSLFITQTVLGGLSNDAIRVMKRMVTFVGVFFMTWFWVWINDFYAVLDKVDSRPTFITYLDVITVCGSGFFNFLIWSTAPAFRKVVCGDHETLCQAIRAGFEEMRTGFRHRFYGSRTTEVGSEPRAPLLRLPPGHVGFDSRGHLQINGSEASFAKKQQKQQHLDPEADSTDSTRRSEEEPEESPRGRIGPGLLFSDSFNKPISEEEVDREEEYRNEDDEFL